MALHIGPKKPAVKICDRIWMGSNLNVDRYQNGDTIPQVTDPTEWANLTTGAWCYYNNDPLNASFGKLYNWYAVNDSRGLALDGWRVATQSDWSSLIVCISGQTGAVIKETGVLRWDIGNGTNTTGFSAYGTGYRQADGTFVSNRRDSWWWNSTNTGAISLSRANNMNTGTPLEGGAKAGLPIRCVKA